MAKGLINNNDFSSLLENENMNQYSRKERQLIKRLAEIEREDSNRCSSCGGEDCICCPYYLDRQRWETPTELFE